jgi:hypothetical protein
MFAVIIVFPLFLTANCADYANLVYVFSFSAFQFFSLSAFQPFSLILYASGHYIGGVESVAWGYGVDHFAVWA